ncbi:MAG: nitrogenase cofactor biosynthesis protein NifB [Methanomassiliicoccales archaeon]
MMASKVDEETKKMLAYHPCYNETAHRHCARMHVPVAPRCNIQCNYCNRRYDCMNESRPGVTSEILSPMQAIDKIRYVKQRMPHLTVIGIAGPGDPLANEETFETLGGIKKEFPDLVLCLSTNGLLLPKFVDRLATLGVKFITVTVNAIDPQIAEKIYDFVILDGKVYKGVEGARILIENQLHGIELASKSGMLVKVNTVMIPGINDAHIPEIAKKLRELGAYIVNIIPLIPIPGTKFGQLRAPTPKERKMLQDLCEDTIQQMRHCRFCRADAIGLLGEDRSAEFAHVTCGIKLTEAGPITVQLEGKTKYKVAVASKDGRNVDVHFGHATRFLTYEVEGKKIKRIGELHVDISDEVPMFGRDHYNKIERAVDALQGFDIIVAKKFGDRAVEALRRRGITAIARSGSIKQAILDAIEIAFEERVHTFE